MKASGKRVKGKRLEAEFAGLIRRYGLDDRAQRRAFSGGVSMVRGRGDILTKLPFSFECKNQEKVKIWEWWEQTEAQASISKPPILVFSGNFRPTMVAMKAETFLDLLKEVADWRQKVRELERKQ